MGKFDFFSKKNVEPEYDTLHISVLDLKAGFIFDYDMSTWEVQEVYTYDWGDNYFSSEYKISDGKRTLFLSVENDDEVCLSITEKIKIRAISGDIPEYISNNEKPPSRITYAGEEYHLESEAPGYFEENGSGSWAELISWSYEAAKGDGIVSIERWGDFEFEAAAGTTIKEYEISNITPKKN